MNNQTQFAQRRERFRGYDDPAAVTAYLERLEREWPERTEIANYIATQIAQLATAAPRVLELCCGPGRLARTILDALPAVQYTGVDISLPFLTYARQQLLSHASHITLHERDLSTDDWPTDLQQQGDRHFDAIVSLQSLHDVGDATVIEQIYRQANALLAPGGFFLNADLIVAEGETLSNNPGRLTIPRHLALLADAGYEHVHSPLAPGGFGVVVGGFSESVG